jgi:DNA-binding transcriptional MerR regulator
VPFNIDGKTVFRIGEALREASVSRATFFRWVREGLIPDTEFRDRNGRRVFTSDEVEQLKQFAHKLVEGPQLRIPLTRAR